MVQQTKYFKNVDLLFNITHIYKVSENGILHVNITYPLINTLAKNHTIPVSAEEITEREYQNLFDVILQAIMQI